MRRRWAELRQLCEPVGVAPLLILFGLAAAERFDFTAYGVLGPEIRHAFHLTNATYLGVASLALVVPLVLTVPIGFLGDRSDRIRLSAISGVVWAMTAIGTGLAPVFAVFVGFRIVGGTGYAVNGPVHNSLLSDYYGPKVLAVVYSVYLLSTSGIPLLAGPLSGGLSAVFGWRSTFVVLAVPTLILVALVRRLPHPERGASIGAASGGNDSTFFEGFRRLNAIRSLRRTWWAAAFFGGGLVAVTPLLSLFFKDVFHLGAFARGGVSAEFGLGGLIGVIIGAPLAQRQVSAGRPSRLTFVNGGMVLVLGGGLIVMAGSPFLAGSLAGVMILSIGGGAFAAAYMTLVALVAPARLRSQAFAWTTLFVALGAIVVAPLIGGLGDAWGQRGAAAFLGVLIAIAGLIELTAGRFVDRDIAEANKNAEASDSDALLSCRGLDVSYPGGVQVLFGVDFEVRAGEVVALLGTNGAGKSTLLRAISGLIDPIGGAVFFDGRDVTHADAVTSASLGIVQVPGGRGVFPGLTVAENLRIAGWMQRRDAAGLKRATERVLGYFPILRRFWNEPAGNLSGGQQQMLTLAQALLSEPKLLMIDELSLGLAPVVVAQLLDTVRRLAADGTTIILVEQSVNVALSVAETAYFMEKGEIRFHGKTADLLNEPEVLRSVFLASATQKAGPKAAPTSTSNGKRSTDDTPVLEVISVSKRFGGVNAVDDVSFALRPHQILGIIGPNGAGKTTLFDLLSGYVAPDGGRVELLGQDVSGLTPDARARSGLGRSFQDARLFPALTVVDTIALAFERHIDVRDPVAAALHLPSVAESEADVAERTEELIDSLGIAAFRDKFVSELSTGSRRIVDLACILAHQPQVILFDEPSSGIAQRETEALGPLLIQARDMTGAALLVIEHDMPLITAISDEIIAMDLGAVITQGAAADVLHHPRVIASYLGDSDDAIARSGRNPKSRRRTRAAAHH